MLYFTLVERPTLIFRVVGRGLYGGIDCVLRRTLDGKLHTTARVVDVVEADLNDSEE